MKPGKKNPTNFQNKVYKVVRKIPKGQTRTYKQIAEKVGSSARAVGQALKKNKNQEVPCHRVIMASGKLGGYKGKRNSKVKEKILRREGAI